MKAEEEDSRPFTQKELKEKIMKTVSFCCALYFLGMPKFFT